MMMVKELCELLATFPEDMQVVTTRYSDLGHVVAEDFELITAIDRGKGAGYLMNATEQYIATMSPADQALIRQYVHIKGN